MIVVCAECDMSYDDTYRFTTCPHDAFEMRTLACRLTPEGFEERICTSTEELHRFLAGGS